MNKLTQVRIAQNTKAAQDVTGVILLGVPMTTQQDNEANIAVMRGQIISIDNQAKTDGCTDPVFGSPEPEVTLKRVVNWRPPIGWSYDLDIKLHQIFW